MSLPIAGNPGGAGKVPSRAPTHRSIDHTRAMKLGSDLEDEVEGDALTFEVIERVSSEQGTPAGHLYAAAATTTELTFAREHEVGFIVCGGRCQQWGALECLEALFDLRLERADADQPLFDIEARACLDACDGAAVVKVRTPDGTATITEATPARLAEAVTDALD